MKKRLHAVCDALRAEHPEAGFRAFVDTAPVPERELGARAGLGWIGKHTLLIHPRLGSWMLLGGFLTTLELDAGSERRSPTTAARARGASTPARPTRSRPTRSTRRGASAT
jgi:epoxyqueuosine reductase